MNELDFHVDLMRAVLWQYENAPKIKSLVRAEQAWADENYKKFWYDWVKDVFNLRTANELGLNIWARILDVALTINRPPRDDDYVFGFGVDIDEDDTGYTNFGNGNFGRAEQSAMSVSLEQARSILLLRWHQLTSRPTIGSINKSLGVVFGPGIVYVEEVPNMGPLNFVFTRTPDYSTLDLLQNTDLLPRPAGVGTTFEARVVKQQVATPTISPDGGSFVDSVQITLTTITPGSSIYYTTDGTDPDEYASEYFGPFTLTTIGNVIVKAIAIQYDMIDSYIAISAFAITSSDVGGVEPRQPYYGVAATIPGIIQAVDYDTGGQDVAYYDTTPGNAGGVYRDDDVDIWYDPAIESYWVGQCPQGEWREYSVNVLESGDYDVKLVVSRTAASPGGYLRLLIDGVAATAQSIHVTNTGDVLNWTTVSAIATLTAGTHIMRVYHVDNAINIASMMFSRIIDDPQPVQTVATPTMSPNGGTFDGSRQVVLSCNTYGAKIYYTTDGTDPDDSSTEYEGPFTLSTTGSATVKAIAAAKDMNDSAINSAAFTITNGNGRGPYGGVAWPIPGIIESVYYDEGGQNVAYFENNFNQGSGFREDEHVDIWYDPELKQYYVGANAKDEWREYSVFVTKTGDYQIDIMVSTPGTSVKVRLEVDGVNATGSIDVPSTGAFGTWGTATGYATLAAGTHILRVHHETAQLNVGAMTFTLVDDVVAPPVEVGEAVTLEWNAVANADGYRLYSRKGAGSAYGDVPAWSGSNNTCTVTVDDGATTYFVVRAFKQETAHPMLISESSNSNEISVAK